MAEPVSATVPGHVTGFFTIEPADDPTLAGSRGAGITLHDGVTLTLTPAATTSIRLDGDQVAVEAVDRVLSALDVTATVDVDSAVPLGAGFGVSGGMALGTALAAVAAFDRSLSENELVTIAHGAEVQAGTGLGDVVAQARGGVPVRLEPGGPHVNELDGVPARGRIEYLADGELATGDVLSGETDRISEAGESALASLVAEPTMARFMTASRTFARETGLLTDWVRDVVDDVAAAGGEATMGMLGETVIALDTGLSDAGYDPGVTAIDPTGATLS